MKELYKLYSNPITECLEQHSEEDNNNGILDKYLATKQNFQTLQDRTVLLQKSIVGKLDKENDIKQKSDQNEFSSRTSEIIEALGGYTPRKIPVETQNNYNGHEENLLKSNARNEINKEVENSIEFIDRALRSVKQTIEYPSVVSRTSTYLEEEKEDFSIRPNSSDERFGDEKMDQPKECESFPSITTARKIPPPTDRVERILKMVEIDYKPLDKFETIGHKINDSNDLAILKSPFDIAYWDQQFQKYSYYAFTILVCTLFLLSILRTTNYVFKTLKKYFDKALLHCWSWIRGIFAPSHPTSEQNVLLFILLTPFIILLLIAYSGFSILYFMNKVLLTRVPNTVAQQFNLQNVRGVDYS